MKHTIIFTNSQKELNCYPLKNFDPSKVLIFHFTPSEHEPPKLDGSFIYPCSYNIFGTEKRELLTDYIEKTLEKINFPKISSCRFFFQNEPNLEGFDEILGLFSEKTFKKDFRYPNGSYSDYDLDPNDSNKGLRHPDGWLINLTTSYDYYEWVDCFTADHPDYGNIWGDFKTVVYADSEAGFEHFVKHHPTKYYDYGDI